LKRESELVYEVYMRDVNERWLN